MQVLRHLGIVGASVYVAPYIIREEGVMVLRGKRGVMSNLLIGYIRVMELLRLAWQMELKVTGERCVMASKLLRELRDVELL